MCDNLLVGIISTLKTRSGELLAGLSIDDSPTFEVWLMMHREIFHRQKLDALQILIAYYRSLHAHSDVRNLAE